MHRPMRAPLAAAAHTAKVLRHHAAEWVRDARIARALDQPMPARTAGPLVVAGFLGDERGVAEAARLGLRGLRAAGLAPTPLDISPMLQGAAPPPLPGAGGALVIHANPPELRKLLATWAPQSWRGRYRVGYWNWELPDAPRAWLRAARWLDEIWISSAFSAEAFTSIAATTPVRVMRLPAPAPARTDPAALRARLGIPADRVVVLVGFDLRSSRRRKNPDGALSAYETATADGAAAPAHLVLKINGAEGDPGAMAAIAARVAHRADVTLIAERLDAAGIDDLVWAADIVLSLHRAEGFGLWLAQAMRAGKAVIATGWSGNMGFMDAGSAALVPHRLVPVADAGGPYAGIASRWAEPDVAAAAALLRRLIDDPAARAHLGARARDKAAVLDEDYRPGAFSAAFMAAIGG